MPETINRILYKAWTWLCIGNAPCILQDFFDIAITNTTIAEALEDLRDRVVEHIKWIIHGRVED